VTPYLVALILALALSAALTPLAMALAVKTGFLDRPNTALKTHAKPIPYLGGLAICAAATLAALAVKAKYFPAEGEAPWPLGLERMRGVYAVLAGAGAAMLLGLVDDKKVLSPAVKFGGQILASLILVWAGLRVRFVDNSLFSGVLTVFWVVTVTNAVNFIDIMDGLAAGCGALASLAFFAFALHAGRMNDALLALALAGSCLGFLIYNHAPAKVYMGDAGSHFIGFALAGIALNLQYSHQNHLAVFSPLVILALPLFDLMLMTVIRTRKGIPPWKGSPDHVPLRLKALGWDKRRVVWTLWAVTAGLGALTYLSSFLSDRQALLAWGGLALAAVFVAAWLMSIEMPHDKHAKKTRATA
jgi:UDP-GlcNAc:undecaprenyl-phosphate GlcNAc-1-phosphate transferase